MNPPSQSTVVDPMFAGRARRQLTPSYVRRQTTYVTSRQPEIRQQQPTPAPVTSVSAAYSPAPTVSQVVTEQVIEEPVVPLVSDGYFQPEQLIDDLMAAFEDLLYSAASIVQRLGMFLSSGRRLVRLPRITDWRIGALYAMAAVVFVAGLLVSIGGARTNHAVAAQVTHLQQQTTKAATSVTGTSAATVVPSAAKPSASSVASYAVSPNLPRYIDIPALGIHAKVLSEGVSQSNQLQVPWNIYDTGWYNASAQPGQPGAMLIDGHSGIDGLHGVFYKLGSLNDGDQIIVTRGDGQKFTYTVIKVQIANVNDVNMQSMVVSADANAPGLNLITCTGDQIPGTDQLNERVQVYAVMQ